MMMYRVSGQDSRYLSLVWRSNFNGSNILGTMEIICSRHGFFDPIRVNHCKAECGWGGGGSKNLRMSF